MMMYGAQRARLTFLLQYMWHTVDVLVLMHCLLADGRTPLIPASFPGKLVTTFGADMTPIKRAAQPREVHYHACALLNMSLYAANVACQNPPVMGCGHANFLHL